MLCFVLVLDEVHLLLWLE